MQRRLLVLLAIAFALTSGAPRRAEACATAPPHDHRVDIAGEEVLLVWDATKKVEHFVRRVVFEVQTEGGAAKKAASDFGFLVPTPTKPELAEANDALFDALHEVVKPAVVHKDAYDVVPGCLFGFTMRGISKSESAGAGALAPVHVLGEARVAGLDATILEATDVAALGKWLGDHGYPFRPALEKWVKPYVDAKWKITAFKYASREVAAVGSAAALGAITSSTLRMTFASERAFYPYREPDDAAAVPMRSLRVFALSNARLEGAFGEAGVWPVSTPFAKNGANLDAVRAAVPGASLAGLDWLTQIDDNAQRRVADDVWFRNAARQDAVVPEPFVIHDRHAFFLPVEPLLLGGIVLFFVLRRKHAKRNGVQT